MTPKQIEKIKVRILNIRKTLAWERKTFGGYDDSRGLRYIPTRYFIQIGDFKGGLTYTRWFDKNFPGDGAFPDFLLEWTIILFKNGKLREAEKKAFQTFCRNSYLFDKFFDRPVIPIEKWEGSNLETPAFVELLGYSSKQDEFADFSEWLAKYLSTEKFISLSREYLDIRKKLKNEKNPDKRSNLTEQAAKIADSA